ncbi:copper resistance protein B [Verticiella sediminum]|uniref:Copper resistance protein B n=2 Tax=Verticiella sediminum TaxID=1247510 RepID=A0A556AV74_9BURK|nr:copper resistance protein B [Verticiella sediminum]
MQMQGGAAPADARDPHGYSNGLKLGSGDYAVPGVPRLVLADEHFFASLRAETLERRFTRKGDDSTAYDLQAWYGTTYNKAVVKAEGDIVKGKLAESRTELLWGHAVAAYWDTQLGVRVDNGEGPSRQWLSFGIQGLAPYWFELEATGYVGSAGRTALRIEASYELLLTQRLILEPRTELQLYGKDDPERGIGKGLAEVSAGLRLRYEINRQFAPYIGVERAGSFGRTADYVRAEGGRAQQTRWVAGVRFWF